MIRFTDPRACVPIVLLALTLLAPARPAKAQFVVWDPGNYAGRLVEYAMQGLQYAENIRPFATSFGRSNSSTTRSTTSVTRPTAASPPSPRR